MPPLDCDFAKSLTLLLLSQVLIFETQVNSGCEKCFGGGVGGKTRNHNRNVRATCEFIIPCTLDLCHLSEHLRANPRTEPQQSLSEWRQAACGGEHLQSGDMPWDSQLAQALLAWFPKYGVQAWVSRPLDASQLGHL